MKTLSATFAAAALVLLAALPGSAQSNASCSFHFLNIPFPNNESAIPEGINAYSTIVGYVTLTNPQEGFIRYSNGGVSTYRAPNSSSTTIMRRNSSGVNVGYYTPTGSSKAKGFVKSGSGFQSVVVPGSFPTYLNGINKYGTIVGDYIGADNHFHGFVLKNGQFTSINPGNGAIDVTVSDINDNGAIVGTFSNGGVDSHGFLLSGGTYHVITFPNEVGFGGTTLTDISNSGEIVGDVWTGSDSHQGFLRKTSGAYEFISAPNARLTLADGINASNVIVGNGVTVSSTGNEKPVVFTATCQ